MMLRPLIALALVSWPVVVLAEPKSDHAAAIARFHFTTDKKFGCVDPAGQAMLCKLSVDTNIQSQYAPDRKHALVFVDYVPDATGNAGRHAVIVTEEAEETGGWSAEHFRYDINGEEPTNIKFARETVSFTLKTRKPNDPRCCPTGRKIITLPLGH